MITRLFDLFFAPFAHLSPWCGLTAISLVSGVVLLVLFRFTSNQRALLATKRRLFSHLLEVVLYRDEMPVVVRAQGRLILDNLRYLSLTLIPLLCMILPAAVLLLQIDLRYGRQPLAVGQPTIVSVKLRAGQGPGALGTARLEVPPGLRVETPGLRIPAEGEVDWRLSGATPGRYDLRIVDQGRTLGTKTLVVGASGGVLSSVKVQAGLLGRFLHPGEAPLPANGPIESIAVTYPGRLLPLGHWRLLWIWPWLVLAMVFGYALRGPLRVQI